MKWSMRLGHIARKTALLPLDGVRRLKTASQHRVSMSLSATARNGLRGDRRSPVRTIIAVLEL